MANSVAFDTICEILVRLPVKSLIRFKCVCKPWHSFISSPDFIKFHHKYSLETNANSSIIFAPATPKDNYDEFELGDISWIYRASPLYPTLGHKLYLPASLITSGCFSFDFVGSCNGFICIICSHSFLALINPLTRVFKRVPFPASHTSALHFKACYGFGYDSQGDDYKIVGIIGCPVEVYSLRTQSWRSLSFYGVGGKSPSWGANGVFVNNRLYWKSQHSVLSFDLHDEEWHDVPLPNYDHVPNYKSTKIGVLDGCLYVTCSIFTSSLPLPCTLTRTVPLLKEGVSHVWAMREYGVTESWTLLFSLPFPRAMPLVNIKQQHEVLLSKGRSNGLYIWNTKEQTMRKIEGPKVNYSQVAVCVDSLCVDSLSLLAHDDLFTLDGEDEENYKKQGRNKTNLMIEKEFELLFENL